MREAKLNRLREAYMGALTLREIARANGVGEKWLERFWRDERAAGRIANMPRPHFAKFCKPAAALIVEAVEADIAADDDAPIGEPNPRFERECGALLDALRRHHPDKDNAEANTAPEWLAFQRAQAERSAARRAVPA
jgi:transcriptional regulator with XRE-family HTH domain